MTTPTVIPNPGLHLSSYTVYDRPGSSSRAVYLCDDCASKRRANGTMASKWSGECINGYCDDCQAGPSVSHFRLADDPPPPTAMTTAFFPSAPKSIGYDKLTKDYMAAYDGNVIGYFPNYSAAEEALNDYVLDLCVQGLIDQPLAALAEQALIAANPPEPAPPIDDGEQDNWGGFRQPIARQVNWNS